MRRETLLFLALAFPITATGCGDAEVHAGDLVDRAKGGLEGLDLSQMSTGAMQEKVGELTRGLVSELGGIDDAASALDVKKQVEPVLGQLDRLKAALGDKMPDLGSLATLADQLRSRFQFREDVLEVLKPVLDKIRGLTS